MVILYIILIHSSHFFGMAYYWIFILYYGNDVRELTCSISNISGSGPDMKCIMQFVQEFAKETRALRIGKSDWPPEMTITK